MKNFKHYFKEFIDTVSFSPRLPDQSLYMSVMKLGTSMTNNNFNVDIENRKKQIKNELVSKIYELINFIIRETLIELKIDENEEFIFLTNKNKIFFKIFKDFTYDEGIIKLKYQTDLINDEIFDVEESLIKFQKEHPDIQFNKIQIPI